MDMDMEMEMDDIQGEEFLELPANAYHQNFGRRLPSDGDSDVGRDTFTKMNEIRSIEPPEDSNQIEL